MAIQLSLTEDQAMLAQTANAFFAEHSPLTRLRKLRDSGEAQEVLAAATSETFYRLFNKAQP